jgi:excinuclease ABC subunit C
MTDTLIPGPAALGSPPTGQPPAPPVSSASPAPAASAEPTAAQQPASASPDAAASPPIPTTPPDPRQDLREKVRNFPRVPGVYLMRDNKGRVIYVGKAKSLRARVGSYFQDAADHPPKVVAMMQEVVDVEFLEAHSEADALLIESRLIKDIQPKYNKREKDDKTFPYIEITTRDDFPGVFLTRTPRPSGTKLYGPFTSVAWTREAISKLQKVFKYRTCTLEIDAADPSRRHFRPCLLYHINQCTAPCADRIGRDEYRKDIERFKRFMEGNREKALAEMRAEMEALSAALKFEEAKRVRDQIKAVESLSKRGELDRNVQPEAFHTDPTKGLEQLQRLLGMRTMPRVIEGIDIAHLQGSETVGSLVCFVDGRPFKNGYRKFKVRTVAGVDDFASIREVVTRRYTRLQGEADAAGDREGVFPDLVMIDGGLGQLHAALEAFEAAGVNPPKVISLAKREEEIFVSPKQPPLRLPRNSPALRLLQYLRDEAHRFAQHYHHVLRTKSTFEDELRKVRRKGAASQSRRSRPQPGEPGSHSDPHPPGPHEPPEGAFEV